MHTKQLELLPTFPINPVWPAKHTLAAEALAHLLNGERLTQISFGTNRWRLAAYIHGLRSLGWPVQATLVSCPGRHRPIAQYWLSDEVVSRSTFGKADHVHTRCTPRVASPGCP
nr:helix-turn-helix domain-containing protein [Paraburkholderia hospita]